MDEERNESSKRGKERRNKEVERRKQERKINI
jgi:hypothetical protein